MARTHGSTSLRSKTPLGLSNLSSLAMTSNISKRSPRSKKRSSHFEEVLSGEPERDRSANGIGSTSLNLKISMKRNTEWNRIVEYNTKKYQQELKNYQDMQN